MSRSRRIGTAWESKVVAALCEVGWNAERRALAGNHDRGDIAGVGITIECKAEGVYHPSVWLSELAAEMRNDKSSVGVVVAKKKGSSKVEDAYVLMSWDVLIALLVEAGY